MDKLGICATIIVYIGFWIVPDNPITGIILLIISNGLWIYRGVIRRDWSVVMWQAGFVFINLRWLFLSIRG